MSSIGPALPYSSPHEARREVDHGPRYKEADPFPLSLEDGSVYLIGAHEKKQDLGKRHQDREALSEGRVGHIATLAIPPASHQTTTRNAHPVSRMGALPCRGVPILNGTSRAATLDESVA